MFDRLKKLFGKGRADSLAPKREGRSLAGRLAGIPARMKKAALGVLRFLRRLPRLLFIDGPRWLIGAIKRVVLRVVRWVAGVLKLLFVEYPRRFIAAMKSLLIGGIGGIIRRLVTGVLSLIFMPVNRMFGKKKAGTGSAVAEEAVISTQAPAPVLETYAVNEPFAYVSIEDRNPPCYVVKEPSLTDGERELLGEIKTRLYESLGVHFSGETAVANLKQAVEITTRDFHIKMSTEDTDRIMYYVVRDLIGYGKIDPILQDKQIEDISADGPGIPIYVYHRRYGSLQTSVIFKEEELNSLIYKFAQRSGRHISLARPLLDASLPNKDRLQLTIGAEVTTRGSTFTIRKFRETPFTPLDLINYGTISIEIGAYFWMAVENGFNILISGGTASGKTSTLNALAMFIPRTSKIVTLEDTREINILHENWIPSVTREGGGRNPIEMFDLLRAALRQRPEYLLVGEVRGREAYTLFQAMATGHITISTVHADSVEAVVRRLTKPPIDVPLMLLDSLDVVILQAMVKVGDKRSRRVVGIVEITGVDFENEGLHTNEVFTWKPDEFVFTGESRLFMEMMSKLSLSEEELAQEFTRRVEILRLLKERQGLDFHVLSQLLFDYSLHPEEVERKVKEGLI